MLNKLKKDLDTLQNSPNTTDAICSLHENIMRVNKKIMLAKKWEKIQEERGGIIVRKIPFMLDNYGKGNDWPSQQEME